MFTSFVSNAQCFEIESILVDACGSPEGENEMVRIKVGNADLCTNDFSVVWANNNNPWLGISQNATTGTATAALNASIVSCGFLLEPTSCVLPAGETVILVTSEAIDVNANSFANLTDTIYIIYQTAGNTNGHFANYNSTPGLRTLTMSFSSPAGCTDVVTYERSNLTNINGGSGGTTAQKNGATANFDPAGNVTYSNNGCQAPFTPFVVDLTAVEVNSGSTTICPGDIIQVGVSIQGPFQEVIWTGFNGVFDNQNVIATNYNSDLTDNVDFYLYVSVVSNCGDTLQDSVLFTVNPVPIVNPAGPFTTFSGTQTIVSNMGGGVWSADCGVCIDANTGVFDPSVSGEGTFQICYTAGCGQDCISILVDDNCTMSWTINSSNPICFESNDGDVTIIVSGAVGATAYIISDENGIQVNASNSTTANNLIEGWYYFAVTDDLCTIIDSVFLNDPEELNLLFTVVDPNCYGLATGLTYVDTIENYSGTYDDVNILWSQGSIGNNIVTNDSMYNVGADNYYLSVSDLFGCQKTIVFTVAYPDSIYFSELGSKPTVCRSSLFYNGLGQVYAAAFGGADGNGNGINFSYEWTELSTGNVTSNSTWGNLNPGDYMILATNDLGCVITQTITVDSLNPEAIFTLTSPNFTSDYEGTAAVNITLINESVNYSFANNPLYSNNTNVDTSFTWTFGFTGENPYITGNINEIINQQYLEEGEYEICLFVIENLNQCSDSTCQTIIVYDKPNLDIPNVFTPDSDGVNDQFFFPNKAIIEFTCSVYDRWGKLIFEFNSIDDSWDGTYYLSGKECVDGVYFYMYEGKSSNGTEYKGQGNVHLIRK